MTSNKVVNDSKLYQVRYGDEKINFIRKARKSVTSRILIQVNANHQVIVNVPEGASDEVMLLAVRKRARWIWKQLQTFKQQQRSVYPRRYLSGETHYYLGRRYLLKVLEDAKGVEEVKLRRGRFEVTVLKKSPETIRLMLDNWYKERAREVFSHQLDQMLSKTYWLQHKPSFRLFMMRKQWGSCSPQGMLTLNPYLVKAPKRYIDYVLLHELCHIAEHNHSKRFYRLLEELMPDWKQTKVKLDEMADVFLNDVAIF